MLCSHCGAELEDFATFCPSCGKIAIPPKRKAEGAAPAEDAEHTEEKQPKKFAQRLYPPMEEPDVSTKDLLETPADDTAGTPIELFAPPPKKPQQPKNTKKMPKYNCRLVVFSVIMAIITAAAIGAAAYVISSTHGLRVELTKAQTERASAEASVTALGNRIAELETTLAGVKKERDELSGQVTELSTQINSMESSVNQSAYDKESAERELAQAQEDVKALSGQVTEIQNQLTEAQGALTEAQSANEQLQTDYDELEKEYKATSDEIGFYDTYVVFVMLNSDTKYYHKYDCEDFTKRNFLAYSTKLAEANGYSKCPKCG